LSAEGRTALVTGGSRGIGRAIALKLAEGCSRIAINYHKNHAAAEACLGCSSRRGWRPWRYRRTCPVPRR
jgi:3-oxoacyl-[acyl-carrier protein] reductase